VFSPPGKLSTSCVDSVYVEAPRLGSMVARAASSFWAVTMISETLVGFASAARAAMGVQRASAEAMQSFLINSRSIWPCRGAKCAGEA
jgi:hypothetical protein